MRKETKLGIVSPINSEAYPGATKNFIEKIFGEIPQGFSPTIYVPVSNVRQEGFVQSLMDIGTQEDRLKILDFGTPDKRGLAYAYLGGMKQAILDKVETVVEIDANGAHDPAEIREFLNVINTGRDAALSTRFSLGGKSKYPIQRIAISYFGTVTANLMLNLGGWVSDMTSGYEAFDAVSLNRVLSLKPIENWVSVVYGPGHFIQTELRSRGIISTKWNYAMVPIIHGVERNEEPQKLKLKTVLKAFTSLIKLRKDLNNSH